MAFAAGAYVFPGGSVDPRDTDQAVAWAGPSPADWGRPSAPTRRLARGLVCAAVRETFEESGVLLAGPAADSVVADTTGDDWEADRLALIDRSLSFADFLAGAASCSAPTCSGRGRTGSRREVEPRRFDTRFFVAALPDGQRTRDVGGEADQVAWAASGGGGRAGRASGEIFLMPPDLPHARASWPRYARRGRRARGRAGDRHDHAARSSRSTARSGWCTPMSGSVRIAGCGIARTGSTAPGTAERRCSRPTRPR